jgi:hypothetical protein
MHRLRSLMRNPLVWVIVLTLAYAAVVATRPSEAWFGVPGEWTWSGRPPAASTAPRRPPAIAALTATAVFVVLMDRHWIRATRTTQRLALATLIVIIPVLQVLLKTIHYAHPLEFYLHRTIGPHNGFWQAAIGIKSLITYLRTYPEAMLSAMDAYVHLTTAPPGGVIYLWVWRQAFSAMPQVAQAVARLFRSYACADLAFVRLDNAQIAAALGQMSIPLWSGLTVLPLYAWASQVGSRRDGWRAAALFTLLPTLSLFTLRWDTLYPFFTATAFATLHRGITTGKARWWGLSGAVVSLASFFSFGNALLAPAVALYAALALWSRARSWRALAGAWRGWIALLIGGYSVWGAFQIIAGVSVWRILAVTSQVQVRLREAYSYPKWLYHNLWDILAMSGFPITLPFLMEAVSRLRPRPSGGTRTNDGVAGVPALTFAATLLAITISGLSPGEVARLWLHLTTGMIIAAVVWLHRRPGRYAYAVLVGLMALQSLWLTLFLRVSETGRPSYEPRVVSTSLDEPVPALATFGDELSLSDISVTPGVVAPGETVKVDMTWHAERRTDVPLTLFVHLVDTSGMIVAQKDAMPHDSTYPTTCWTSGEIVDDTFEIDLPPHAMPGLYSLRIGWYDLATMERLRLSDSDADSLQLPDVVEVR